MIVRVKELYINVANPFPPCQPVKTPYFSMGYCGKCAFLGKYARVG